MRLRFRWRSDKTAWIIYLKIGEKNRNENKLITAIVGIKIIFIYKHPESKQIKRQKIWSIWAQANYFPSVSPCHFRNYPYSYINYNMLLLFQRTKDRSSRKSKSILLKKYAKNEAWW